MLHELMRGLYETGLSRQRVGILHNKRQASSVRPLSLFAQVVVGDPGRVHKRGRPL